MSVLPTRMSIIGSTVEGNNVCPSVIWIFLQSLIGTYHRCNFNSTKVELFLKGQFCDVPMVCMFAMDDLIQLYFKKQKDTCKCFFFLHQYCKSCHFPLVIKQLIKLTCDVLQSIVARWHGNSTAIHWQKFSTCTVVKVSPLNPSERKMKIKYKLPGVKLGGPLSGFQPRSLEVFSNYSGAVCISNGTAI